MIQEVFISIIFLMALCYLGWKIRKQFKGSCGGGCSACSSVDFKKIEKQLTK